MQFLVEVPDNDPDLPSQDPLKIQAVVELGFLSTLPGVEVVVKQVDVKDLIYVLH